MTDAELMKETHWCPYCDVDTGLTVKQVVRGRVAEGSVELVVTCPNCGEHYHDPHDTDCWCLK